VQFLTSQFAKHTLHQFDGLSSWI